MSCPRLPAVVCLAVAAGPAAAQYTFTKVADTAAGSGYYAESFAAVALNNRGVVAFDARLNADGTEHAILRATAGGPVTTVFNNCCGPFAGHKHSSRGSLQAQVSINTAGEVAFATSSRPSESGRTGVYRSDGTAVTAITAPCDPGSLDGLVSRIEQPVRINDRGTVVFSGRSGSCPRSEQAVYTGAGGPPKLVSQPTPRIAVAKGINGDSTIIYHTYNAMYHTCDLEYARLYSIIRVTATGDVSTVLDSADGRSEFDPCSAELDAAGRVYLVASRVAGAEGGRGVYRWDNGAFSHLLGGERVGRLAVNGQGHMATTLADGDHPLALYLVAYGVTTRMFGVGDELDGSTITRLSYGSQSLNDAGQFAFAATLADGRTGLFVATPGAVPTGSAGTTPAAGLLVFGTATVVAGLAWQLQSRRRASGELRRPGETHSPVHPNA